MVSGQSCIAQPCAYRISISTTVTPASRSRPGDCASGTVAVVEGFAYVVFGTRLVKRIGGKRGGNDKSAKIVHISARCGGALFLRGALALAIAIAPHATLLSSAQGALWLALLAPQIVEIGVVLCLTWESACSRANGFADALWSCRLIRAPVFCAVRPKGSVLERASFLALVRHSISGTSLLDAENVHERGSFAVNCCGMFYVIFSWCGFCGDDDDIGSDGPADDIPTGFNPMHEGRGSQTTI